MNAQNENLAQALRPIAETLAQDPSLMSDIEGLLDGTVSWDEIQDTPGEEPAKVWAETLGGTVEEWREIFAE